MADRDSCPTIETLEAYLRASTAMGPVAMHIRQCTRCGRKVSELRGHAALLGELREASRDGSVDEALRARLVEICRRVEDETTLDQPPENIP